MSIGEGILINGVTEILKKLVPVIAREIGLAWGVKNELKKLQDTLEMILAVVADAERRQVTDYVVRIWLRRLKDVAYDAHDVMDEFSYETMLRREMGKNLKHKARDFVSSANPLVFRFKMAVKIKNINRRLDEITAIMSRFQLQTTARNTLLPRETSEERSRQTASYTTNKSYIIGREHEKKKIIQILTEEIPSSSTSSVRIMEKVSVVSIVGMGGLGKTTLAQLVYNDKLVDEQFNLKIWIHVSERFDVKNLLTNIMEASTWRKFDDLLNFDVLVRKVREQLNGKRFLLILDDLWNENAEQWERFCSPLLVGAQGSKILITTRKAQVADVVRGSIPPYKLENLEDDQCWSIIEKKVFSPGGAVRTSTNMTRIGQAIAKKCNGLPVAAVFRGALMHSRNTEVDWLSIQQNDSWITQESQRNIILILKLSYDNFSPELKNCFSYCSIFPKDWEINRVTLVQLWIAEGLLDTCDVRNGRSIEDIGDEYFKSLVWSSFLDGVQKNSLDDIVACKMHDLAHDLAQEVARDLKLAPVKVSELHTTSNIRRLQLILDEDISSVCMKRLSNAKKLQTLIIPEGSNPVDPFIFLENSHLRVLHVGPPSTHSFPKLFSLSSKLRHLRYLRLTSLDLRTAVNDSSINKLYNLETLVLTNITGVQNLLANVQFSQKLRFLDLSLTDMVELPDSVTCLCNLQTLDLHNCKLETIPDSISGLINLRFLNLSFNPIQELPVSVITLSNLETLDTNTCIKLKALPENVAGLAKLRIFDFKDCQLLTALPEDFGTLTHLRYLNLVGTQIKVLPESCANLRNIEYLNLQYSELPKDVKNWRKLRKIASINQKIPGVGKLVSLETLVYSVPEKLNEAECTAGIEELGNLNSLQVLEIADLQNVKDPVDAARANLKGKQELRHLSLRWVEIEEEGGGMRWDQKSCDFQVFEALQPPTCLRRLEISNFMGRDLPAWMCDSSGLQVLLIDGCKSLKEIPSLPSLRILELMMVDHKVLSSVRRIQTSLTNLRLENIEDLIYFPRRLFWNYCTLQYLRIEKCNQFQWFRVNEDDDDGGDEISPVGPDLYCGSLQELEFIDCPVLKIPSGLQGWTSLQKLIIFNCPQVKESLTYDLKSLSFLKELYVDFLQIDDRGGDPSTEEDLINILSDV